MMEWLRLLLERFGVISQGGIYYIGGSDILPPPLKGQDELEALERWNRGKSLPNNS